MEQTDSTRCQHYVKNNPTFVFSNYHQCTNKAAVEIDGEWFCRIHAIKKIKNKYATHRQRHSQTNFGRNRKGTIMTKLA